jgi:tetratricopeptide (TPR) repeat protein
MTCGVDFPELYYVKTKYHYELGEWEEAYITAITAIKLLPDLKPSCRNSFFEYSENKLLHLTKDCALKINLFAEATEIFRKLNDVNRFGI